MYICVNGGVGAAPTILRILAQGAVPSISDDSQEDRGEVMSRREEAERLRSPCRRNSRRLGTAPGCASSKPNLKFSALAAA